MRNSGTIVACVLGYTAALPWMVVFLIMCLHYGLMLGDSAALTAGLVASTPPMKRGATLAVYSFFGFGAGFLGPLAFGLVFDLAGGDGALAWGLAFASLGVGCACAPLAAWLTRRKETT